MKNLALLLLMPLFGVIMAQKTIFSQNFVSLFLGQKFDSSFINKNKNGKNSWRVATHNASKTGNYAKMSAYNTDGEEEDWLILKVDLTQCFKAQLQFETAVGYYDKPTLKVFVTDSLTTDFSTFKPITARLAEGKDVKKGKFSDFVSSGKIDVSDYCGGILYLGFQYVGNKLGQSTLYELDNILIEGE